MSSGTSRRLGSCCVYGAAAALFAATVACSTDARVFRGVDTGADGPAGAGAAGAFAFGCPGVTGFVSTGEWLRAGAPCESDSDCLKTLFTPVCDPTLGRCVACPELEQQSALSVRVGTCIGLAVARCCGNPDASPDCLYRDCASPCEAR